MEFPILDPLLKITQALKEGKADGKQASIYLAECIDNLLHIEAKTDNEMQDVLHEYLPVFDQLVSLLPNTDVDLPYYRSIAAIIRGDYKGYLMETERFYVIKSVAAPNWLNWFAADQYFVSILVGLPVLGHWDEQIEGKIIRAHQKYAAKYFSKSAFDLYCKFWASKNSDRHRLKLLRDVLEKDPQWVWAWVEMGDIYYNQKKWAQALNAYQNAMADEQAHFASIFFWSARAAEQLKELDTAIEYYRRCVELNPDFQYAQNNLGWALNRQKRHTEAEPYLLYALEHDENKRYASRDRKSVV